MQPVILSLAAILLLTPVFAQRGVLINTATPQGKALQAIAMEKDPQQQLKLMEQFMSQYGDHEGAAWVLSQMQQRYLSAGAHDKVLETGEKLLKLDPSDLEGAYANLKAAEARKDSDAVLKWSAATSENARKKAQTPKRPEMPEDEYKADVDYAKQLDTYSEYALYAIALTESDPQKVIKLAETIEQRNPNSQYIALALPRYAWAAKQANQLPQAMEYGERAFARGVFHEDFLLAMADYYLNLPSPKQDLNKVALYSAKIVETLPAKAKPDGFSDADWQKKKTTTLGLAHWMAGTALSTQGKYAPADTNLRAALPLIKENEQLLAGALFHLGLANYQLGKGKNPQQVAEALKFLQQCAAMKSPYQEQAQKNAAVIRKEVGRAK